MKSSGELKSRGVKLLPGKDNNNKLSLSEFPIYLYANHFLCVFVAGLFACLRRGGSLF